MSTPAIQFRPTKRPRFTRRIEFPSDGGSIVIDVFGREEALQTCIALTRAGHEPRLYKLDSEGDGILIATFEKID